MKGFKQFLADQGVVGFAVALVIGLAAVEMINDVFAALISPIITQIAGAADLSEAWAVSIGDVTLQFGAAIDAIIRFLIFAFVVYFVVNTLKLDQLDSKKSKK